MFPQLETLRSNLSRPPKNSNTIAPASPPSSASLTPQSRGSPCLPEARDYRFSDLDLCRLPGQPQAVHLRSFTLRRVEGLFSCLPEGRDPTFISAKIFLGALKATWCAVRIPAMREESEEWELGPRMRDSNSRGFHLLLHLYMEVSHLGTSYHTHTHPQGIKKKLCFLEQRSFRFAANVR